jgi:hypothetical protein
VAKWDLKGLKALVQANGNLAAFQQASELVNTISWKMDAFKYHKFLFFEAHDQEPECHSDALRLMLGSDEASNEFGRSVAIQQFNAVAAAATVHTIPEVFAQLTAMLLLNAQLKSRHDVSIYKVRTALDEGPIKEYFDVLSQSEEYRYLTAFVNMSKHVSMSQPSYSINYESEAKKPHGLVFKAFEYKGQGYPEKQINQLFEELHGLNNGVIKAGVDLNYAIGIVD